MRDESSFVSNRKRSRIPFCICKSRIYDKKFDAQKFLLKDEDVIASLLNLLIIKSYFDQAADTAAQCRARRFTRTNESDDLSESKSEWDNSEETEDIIKLRTSEEKSRSGRIVF